MTAARLNLPHRLAAVPVVDLRHLRESRQPMAAFLVGAEQRGETTMLVAHLRGTLHVRPGAREVSCGQD